MGVDYFVAVNRSKRWLSTRFVTPKRVAQLTNHFLAPHYHIELADDWQWETTGLTLPELKVKTDQCTLVNLNNTQVTWWNTHSLDVEKASMNYDCLTHLPSDDAEKHRQI